MIVSRYPANTMSPVCTAPAAARCAPTSSTASVPRLGSSSMTGSKTARRRPTRTLAARSSSARAANLASSRSSVPSDLTRSDASKLSWATSATRARSCWACVAAGLMYRWKTTLARVASGSTVRAVRASHVSIEKSATAATRIITTTPSANGRGLNTPVAASTSELALASSCPVGWARCQDIGRRRYWRVTPRRWPAWMSAYPTPAKIRRPATPTASTTATATRTSPAVPRSPRAPLSPASAGITTRSVTMPSTWLTPTVAAPNTAESPTASR